MPVQGARHQFLAGTGLAVDQHRGVRLRQAADGAKDFLQRRALTQDLGYDAGLLCCTILVRRLGNRPAHQIHGLIDVERLGQVLEGAALESRHGRIEIGIGGHDDDRQIRVVLLDVAQQVEAALARHADVGNHHLRPRAVLESRQHFVGGTEAPGRNVLPTEGLFQHPADGAVVVDDPDRIHGAKPSDAKSLFISLPSSLAPT